MPDGNDLPLVIFAIVFFAVCAKHIWSSHTKRSKKGKKVKSGRWLAALPAAMAVMLAYQNFAPVRAAASGAQASLQAFSGGQTAHLAGSAVLAAVAIAGCLRIFSSGPAKRKKG